MVSCLPVLLPGWMFLLLLVDRMFLFSGEAATSSFVGVCAVLATGDVTAVACCCGAVGSTTSCPGWVGFLVVGSPVTGFFKTLVPMPSALVAVASFIGCVCC